MCILLNKPLGFVFFLGLKCFLIFCSVIFIIIFVWSKISKKNLFSLINQVKSASISIDRDSWVKGIQDSIHQELVKGNSVKIIAHSQGGYLSYLAIKNIIEKYPRYSTQIEYFMFGSGLRPIHWLSVLAKNRTPLILLNISALISISLFIVALSTLPTMDIYSLYFVKGEIWNFFKAYLVHSIIYLSVSFISSLFIAWKMKNYAEDFKIPRIEVSRFVEFYSPNDPISRSRYPMIEGSIEECLVEPSGLALMAKDHLFSFYINKNEEFKDYCASIFLEILKNFKKNKIYRFEGNARNPFSLLYAYKNVKSGFCLTNIFISFIFSIAFLKLSLSPLDLVEAIKFTFFPTILLMGWNILDYLKYNENLTEKFFKIDYKTKINFHHAILSSLFLANIIGGYFLASKISVLGLFIYISLLNSVGTVFSGNAKGLRVFKIGKYLSVIYLIIAITLLIWIFVNINYLNKSGIFEFSILVIIIILQISILFYYLFYFKRYNKNVSRLIQ